MKLAPIVVYEFALEFELSSCSPCSVTICLRFLIVAVLLPSFVWAGTASFTVDGVKNIEVKVTHSHHHKGQHHHDAPGHHETAPTVPQDGHQGSGTEHTHSVVVSCAHVFLNESKICSVFAPCDALSSFAVPENTYPPLSQASGSIFRPPIAA